MGRGYKRVELGTNFAQSYGYSMTRHAVRFSLARASEMPEQTLNAMSTPDNIAETKIRSDVRDIADRSTTSPIFESGFEFLTHESFPKKGLSPLICTQLFGTLLESTEHGDMQLKTFLVPPCNPDSVKGSPLHPT